MFYLKTPELKRYYLCAAICLLSALFIFCFSNIYIHLFSLIVMAGTFSICSGFNLSHPYFWFSAFYFLYSCAYMIVILIKPGSGWDKGYDPMNARLIWTASTVFLLTMTPKVKTYKVKETVDYSLDVKLINWILWILLGGLAICILALRLQGVTSKMDQWSSKNLFWVGAAYLTRFISFAVVLLLFMGEKMGKRIHTILASVLLTAVFSFMVGERDAIIRLILVILLSLAFLGKIRWKHILILIPVGIAFMIFSKYFKYFLSSHELHGSGFSFSELLYEFLNTDFIDCGRNLQIVLRDGTLAGSKGYGILLADFLSAILPARFMNLLFGGVTEWNPSEWYNDLFFNGVKGSRAFTMTGEGYVIGGMLGVIILFLIVSILVSYLYKRARRNAYYAASYIFMVVAVVSCFRISFFGVTTFFVRIPLLFLLGLWILKVIGKKVNWLKGTKAEKFCQTFLQHRVIKGLRKLNQWPYQHIYEPIGKLIRKMGMVLRKGFGWIGNKSKILWNKLDHISWVHITCSQIKKAFLIGIRAVDQLLQKIAKPTYRLLKRVEHTLYP